MLFTDYTDEELQILRDNNIRNTDELLSKTCLPIQRRQLSKKTGIPEKHLLKWASLADLLRIKGVGPKLSELLVCKGNLSCIQDFIKKLLGSDQGCDYVRIKSGLLTNLIKKNTIALLHELRSQKPKIYISQYQVIEAFYEALEVQPRLIIENNSDANFNSVLKNEFKLNFRTSSKFFTYTFSFLFLLIIILLFLLQDFFFNIYYKIDLLVEQYYYIDFSFAEIYSKYIRIELLLISFFVVTFTYIYLFVFELFSISIIFPLKKFLYNNFQLQQSYISYNFQKQIKEFRKKSYLIFGIVAILLIIVSLIFLNDIKNFDFETAKIPIILIGNIFVIIIFFPYLRIISSKKLQNISDQMVIKRVFVINFIYIIFTGLFFYSYFTWYLPLTLNIYNKVSSVTTAPMFTKDIQDGIEKLSIAEQKEPEGIEVYNELVNKISQLADAQKGSLSNVSWDIVSVKIRPNYMTDLFEVLFWILLPAILLYIYYPYFLLNKSKRGILILAIIGISFFLENVLSKNIPKWFLLQYNPIKSFVFIYILVIANVIVFDWILSLISEKKRICPNCNSLIEHRHNYCFKCGFSLVLR